MLDQNAIFDANDVRLSWRLSRLNCGTAFRPDSVSTARSRQKADAADYSPEDSRARICLAGC
jgi:hypothetical protein